MWRARPGRLVERVAGMVNAETEAALALVLRCQLPPCDYDPGAHDQRAGTLIAISQAGPSTGPGRARPERFDPEVKREISTAFPKPCRRRLASAATTLVTWLPWW